MDLGLTNKVAMVAGASRGLGYAVARTLAAEGALVSMSSRDAEAISAAAQRIQKETGGTVLAVAADVQSPGEIAHWHQMTLDRFDDAAWQRAFELLLMSAVRLARLAVPSMAMRGGGSILLPTSSSVKEPIANLALSNILRAAVSSLAKTLAIELAPKRIRVNQLIPGRIVTDRLRELDEATSKRLGISVEEQQQRMESAIPMGRYGDAQEFANAAAFLLSDAASYITGATLQVDGGLIRGVI